MPESMFHVSRNKYLQRKRKDPIMGGEHIQNWGRQVMSVRTSEEFVRKSTWWVAAVSRPLVWASHIIQAGNELFIMNRKKENSVLRKEGNVHA